MNELAIETESLVKCYPGVRALDGLNMKVPRGAVYGFLGRNGAGKSTTIKTLLGLARADSGRARVLDQDCGPDQIGILERTAFVSDHKALYDSMTPRQLVRFNRGFFPKWSNTAVDKYARMFEIPMDRRISKLSRGNRTKVCLLLALSQGAELLVLDEPTSGLDPVYLDDFLRVLVEDQIPDGHTVFFSSHDLAEVEQIAEWVGIIDQGRMLLEARLDDIRSDYRFVTAAGSSLPETGPAVVATTRQGAFVRYLISREAEQFAAEFRQHGAAVSDVSPVSLRELFLALVRKEDICTSGKAGMTPESVS
jgi:ABC-2 type transport system ATP-binding protein